jgi:hypothetical protein|tara:strand:- start:104 stop:907 length:804 start_codon:yes stop_codon:yes gene_type:complete
MVDSVNIIQGEGEDDQAHIDAMVAKADGDSPQTPDNQESTTDERPEWLPEKFKTPEDMAKSYAALEKKMSGGKDTEQAINKAEGDETPTEIPTNDEAKEAATNAGLDFDALQTEYGADGSLSDDTYASIEKSGIPRDVVDAYIAGQEALATKIRTDMFSSVGGEESYGTMMSWASNNLNNGEIEAYNTVMNSSDPNQIQLAVRGLNAQYQADTGSNPALLSGDTTANAGSKFESVAQVTAAMRDPKYKTDPAFRKTVEAKLARSSVI